MMPDPTMAEPLDAAILVIGAGMFGLVLMVALMDIVERVLYGPAPASQPDPAIDLDLEAL